jgi:hypothetical protein
MAEQQPSVTEPHIIGDVFCTEVVEVEQIGGILRLTLGSRCNSQWDVTPELRIVARIVIPPEALASALQRVVDAARAPAFPPGWLAALSGATAN